MWVTQLGAERRKQVRLRFGIFNVFRRIELDRIIYINDIKANAASDAVLTYVADIIAAVLGAADVGSCTRDIELGLVMPPGKTSQNAKVVAE